MSAVVIRAVEAGDVGDVVALLRAVLGEFGLTFGEGSDTDAQVLALPGSYRDHGGHFWVARDAGGGLLGTCGVFPVAPATFELRKMYLDARARGRGVGARLLLEAETWCRAQGGHRLVLDTTHQMTAAIAFYESHGFVRDDAQIRGSRCHRGYTKALGGDR
ncbi:MAG: GNAT family N-acetyltransferase [Polyangiales bacterium]